MKQKKYILQQIDEEIEDEEEEELDQDKIKLNKKIIIFSMKHIHIIKSFNRLIKTFHFFFFLPLFFSFDSFICSTNSGSIPYII